MYETIFEISKFQIPWGYIINGFVVLVSISQIIGAILSIREGEDKGGNIVNIILWTIAMVVFGFNFFISVDLGGSERAWYAKEYYKGNYEVAEGKVTKFQSDEESHSYYVDGIYFRVNMMDVSYSDIKQNGQQVRISYIPYNQPLKDGTYRKECEQIVKFEMAVDEKEVLKPDDSPKEKIKSIFSFNTFVSILFLVISALSVRRSIRGIRRGEPIGEHIIDIVISIGMLIGFIILILR